MTRRKKSKGSKITAHSARRPGGGRRSHGRHGRLRRPWRRPATSIRRSATSGDSRTSHRRPTIRASGRSTCRATTPSCSVAAASTDYYGSTRTISSADCCRTARLMQASLPRRWNARPSTTRHCSPTARSSASVPRGSRTARKAAGVQAAAGWGARSGFRARWTRRHQRRQRKPRGGVFGDRRSGRPHRRGGPAR